MTRHACRTCGKTKTWDLADTDYERTCPDCYTGLVKCRRCGGLVEKEYKTTLIKKRGQNKGCKQTNGQKILQFKYCSNCRKALKIIDKEENA